MINKKEIKLYAFHQASKFVCENLKKKLDLTDKQVFFNYNKFGNMVSASIPILLKEADKKNLIKKDDKVLLCGFGVGLSWPELTVIKPTLITNFYFSTCLRRR